MASNCHRARAVDPYDRGRSKGGEGEKIIFWGFWGESHLLRGDFLAFFTLFSFPCC